MGKIIVIMLAGNDTAYRNQGNTYDIHLLYHGFSENPDENFLSQKDDAIKQIGKNDPAENPLEIIHKIFGSDVTHRNDGLMCETYQCEYVASKHQRLS